MAVYNGERYLGEQIDSILVQMEQDDELLVSVDPCSDRSREITCSYAQKDARIHVLDGPGKGVVRNFENGLNKASGDIIFLSDQDDVWLSNKRERCLSSLEKNNTIAVVHNCTLVDGEKNLIQERFFEKGFQPGVVSNIVRNRYIGCCMAFRRELLKSALLFPKNVPMHDQWLGLLAAKTGTVAFIDEPLMLYRRHSRTVTGRHKAGIMQKMTWRLHIICDFLKWNARRRHG